LTNPGLADRMPEVVKPKQPQGSGNTAVHFTNAAFVGKTFPFSASLSPRKSTERDGLCQENA